MGIQLSDHSTLYTLHFADDQVVISQDKDDLDFMTRRLISEYEKWGLKVNMQKTKYICVGSEFGDLQLEDGRQIPITGEYTYLGTKITRSGRTEPEIEERIIKGKKIIGALNSVLWSSRISREKKHQIFNMIFKSVVLYGCETWQLTSRMEQRLLSLEMDFWRRSARISKLQHIPNITIREIMNVEKTILDHIQEKQLSWYGHVQRMSEHRIPKQIMNWNPLEHRKRGRPKMTWIKGINKAMSTRNLRPGDWEDRDKWRLGTARRITL